MRTYEPTKSEFNQHVKDYINAGLGEIADILAEVENWTDEYQAKFNIAILDWRANS